MKVVVFGAALLACAIPAFAQVDSTIPVPCQAALVSPGVPSAVIVLGVPTPYAAARGPGATQRPGIPSSMTAVHPNLMMPSSPGPFGIGSSAATASGIGAIGTGGIGSIGTGGIGSIGMGGIGSIGAPSVLATAPPVPFTPRPTPPPPVDPSSARRNEHMDPRPGTSGQLAFFCP